MTLALPAYIPLRCTFVLPRSFGHVSFVRVIGGMGYAVRHWADGRSGASIVRLVHEEGRRWSAHYKSEESS
jgi:hypothetical protein